MGSRPFDFCLGVSMEYVLSVIRREFLVPTPTEEALQSDSPALVKIILGLRLRISQVLPPDHYFREMHYNLITTNGASFQSIKFQLFTSVPSLLAPWLYDDYVCSFTLTFGGDLSAFGGAAITSSVIQEQVANGTNPWPAMSLTDIDSHMRCYLGVTRSQYEDTSFGEILLFQSSDFDPSTFEYEGRITTAIIAWMCQCGIRGNAVKKDARVWYENYLSKHFTNLSHRRPWKMASEFFQYLLSPVDASWENISFGTGSIQQLVAESIGNMVSRAHWAFVGGLIASFGPKLGVELEFTVAFRAGNTILMTLNMSSESISTLPLLPSATPAQKVARSMAIAMFPVKAVDSTLAKKVLAGIVDAGADGSLLQARPHFSLHISEFALEFLVFMVGNETLANSFMTEDAKHPAMVFGLGIDVESSSSANVILTYDNDDSSWGTTTFLPASLSGTLTFLPTVQLTSDGRHQRSAALFV